MHSETMRANVTQAGRIDLPPFANFRKQESRVDYAELIGARCAGTARAAGRDAPGNSQG